jgi:cyclopropane-fatty-acyl-phospholipid synthase
MAYNSNLKRNMLNLYDSPVEFWERILGPDLHFHLGHFPHSNITLNDSMGIAISQLIRQLSNQSIDTILDVGCGWGGPSFFLARTLKCKVLGLTISNQQTEYINKQADLHKLPVKALKIDIEEFGFENIGNFDVLLLYEVLEHIYDQKMLFSNLLRAARPHSELAIAVSCRVPEASRDEFYNEYLGIQTLNSVPELIQILNKSGWKVEMVKDYTSLTLPVWKHWAQNLSQYSDQKDNEYARSLAIELAKTEELYRMGLLQSVQVVAKPIS